MFDCLANFLLFIGVYAFGCYLYDNLKSPYIIIRDYVNEKYFGEKQKRLVERFGEWAVITGSTDGIGKYYARELAREGFNVVLISRTKSKLEAVASEIEKEFAVQVKIIVADFSHGAEIYKSIEETLDNIPIGLLVNNVGQSTSKPGPMCSFSAEELWSVINVNIGAVTELSRYFLLRMQKSNIKGAIVNISSGSELCPLPYAAIYAATKAYNRSLTLALQYEASRYGIHVQLVSPHFVVTKINSYSRVIMRGGLFIPDPEKYARWAVSTIGRVEMTSGYFWHGIQCAIGKLFPVSLCTYIIQLFAPKIVDDLKIN
ncbi:hydroxysteroid dehydrogenase-like protein 1 [Teleopsis dalmanni]|uniref:hydroxysteroid dehydrogenase-like protein 1 n=1 Tax=Teleopsis dalmanni TaxID=139649 RepID=UPI0018CED354|nr:hydroxysteroid dehydrogenase-like protein 1 [Teleopsis dalmanni]